MKLLNAEIQPFVNFLMSLELGGKQSRMRTRFCKMAIQKVNDLEEERIELIKLYGKKDKNGKLQSTKNEKGQDVYEMEDIEKFNIEYKEMMLEEWVLENNEEHKDMFLVLKDIVLNTDKKFAGQEALEYDRWCEIVEEIEY